MPSRTIRRPAFRLLVGLAALLLALPVLASKVYQWKDAKGITHYSDAPPPGQQGVQNRQLKDGPTPPEAAKPAEDANCATARKNLVQLQSDKVVGLDADGDGKPDKEMTAEETAAQVHLAETTLKNTCTPGTY